MKAIYILLLFSTSLLQLHGQPLFFHHLTADNGLPHNTVNSFIEDKYGFIWIATLEGLCRFDGYKIVTYYSDNTEKSLINHRPIKLYRDNNDDIWITFSTTNQVCKYNYQSDDFSRYDFEALDISLQTMLNRNTKAGTTYHSASNQMMWNLSDHSLIQTNTKTGEKYTYSNTLSEKGGLPDSFILSIYLDSNDILWIGTDNGGVHYADVNRKAFHHFSYEAGHSIRAICEDNNGFLWIGTRNSGIIRVNKDRSIYNSFSYQTADTYQNESNQVRKIYNLKSASRLFCELRIITG